MRTEKHRLLRILGKEGGQGGNTALKGGEYMNFYLPICVIRNEQ